ncbi:putative skeletal organic matrix protein 3 isoform X2 [Acropora palmata]|uniref:putative skeletal organic matrix protein 3 isoform X2 n=1 Tax=Acropora palmata TaxID=6131 RepID=UPI003D9FC78D
MTLKMKICGLEKLRVFLSLILMVSLLCNGVNGFTIVRSMAVNGESVPDRFSNPSCRPSDCALKYASMTNGCATTRDCCSCQCSKTRATYLTSPFNRCATSEYIDEDCSSFFVLPDDSPPPVADITKPGHINFFSETRCHKGLRTRSWSHSVDATSWTTGKPNVFSVELVEGSSRKWRLSWQNGIDAKYSGLIIKLQFSCQETSSGCFLMKSKGNYTIPNSGGNANPTANSGTSARSNRNEQNKLEAPARNQAELEPKKTGVVVAGVTVSLAAGFVLALATLLLMKKKQTSLMVNAKARPNSYLGYEEPVDSAGRPEQVATESPSFDNEFYTTDCVLSLSGNNVGGKVTRMGPLPPLPGEESIYAEPMIKRSVAYQGLAEKNKQQDAGTACNVQPQPEYKVIEKTSKENSHDKGTDDDKGSSDQDGADNGAYGEGADDDKGGFDQDGADNGAYDERADEDKGGFDQDGSDNGAYNEAADDDKGGFDEDGADNGVDRVCPDGVTGNDDDDDYSDGDSIVVVKKKNDDYDDVVSVRRESEA